MQKDGRMRHSCLFCKKWIYRIPEHMKAHHSSEDRVARLMSLAPKAQKKEKDKGFKLLRLEGDMEANRISLKNGSGYVVVVRKSAKLEDTENYTPCSKCNGVFKSRLLSRHMSTCGASESRNLNLRTSRMLLEHSLSADSKLHDVRSYVVTRMKIDELTNVVKNDEGLLMYGQKLYEKGGDAAFNEISSKLRGMARLLLKYRDIVKSVNLVNSLDLIDASCWDDVVRAVKLVVNHEKQTVGIPSLLLNLGRSLACVAGIKNALGIRRNDSSMREDARNFLTLHAEEWSIYTKHALESMKKDNKPELLPLAADLDKLKDFLMNEIKELTEESKDEQNQMLRSQWSRLQRATLTRLITFNARRGSEPAKLLVTQYVNADDWKRKEDIANLTDPVEKLLAKD